MQFTTVLAAIAAFGISAVSAAPAAAVAPTLPFRGPGLVMTWDLFVGRGVRRVTKVYPNAKVIAITGNTFDGQPTSNIMSVQNFEMKFDADGKTIYTANYNTETGESIPFFTEPEVVGGHMIGNTAFVYGPDTVKVGGFEAQDAFRKEHPTGTYKSITLRNSQHPAGQYYFFNDVEEKGTQVGAVSVKAN